MLYHPPGFYVWDTWYYVYHDTLHCIHLQLPRPGYACAPEERGALGHAVTQDLLHWETLPTALYPGEPGTMDDREIWTGCVLQRNELQYLFYTARSSKENGQVNRIAVAAARDGQHFTRCYNHPILIPDGRWYCNEHAPFALRGHGYPIVDCRDMCVVEDPAGNGYWGYFAARRPSNTTAGSSVIGLAHSMDLLHWEQYPPCFTPDCFGCVEVPDVFFLNGKWYLLCLTGNRYGQRGRMSDPLLREGTVYAVADNPEGPYILQKEDNVLFGSIFSQGYSGKTIQWKEDRILFYTQGEMKDGCPHGCIALPHKLVADHDNRLRARWYSPLERFYEKTPNPLPVSCGEGLWGSLGIWSEAGNGYQGVCDNDWALLPLNARINEGMIQCDVAMETASAAGLAFRMGNSVMDGGLCLLLDCALGQAVITSYREFPLIESRTWPLQRGKRYSIRAVLEGNVIYIYIDDNLVIQCYEPGMRTGGVGLMVEQGKAVFSNLALWAKTDTADTGKQR